MQLTIIDKTLNLEFKTFSSQHNILWGKSHILKFKVDRISGG